MLYRCYSFNLYINSFFYLFDITVNFWEKYLCSLLSVWLLIGLFIGLFFLARRKDGNVMYSNTSLIALNLYEIIFFLKKIISYRVTILLFYNLVWLFLIWLWIFFLRVIMLKTYLNFSFQGLII